jgi:hypothetical protein
MKVSIITPPSKNVEPWYDVFEKMGIQTQKNSVSSDCDFIIAAGHAFIPLADQYHKLFPHIPIINYTWDLYKTIWENPGHYNWKYCLDFFSRCDELWCPSEEVRLRLSEEIPGIEDKCKIILTWARLFDFEDIQDKRYILQPMRPYVSDKNYKWLTRACKELGLPLVEPNHGLSEEEFQRTVAHCSFLCTEYHEASTGGLTLLEGYRLGKPAIVSDSRYMGARDYFGDRAIYFKDDSYEDFKRVVKETWDNTPVLDKDACRTFTDRYSLDKMVEKMVNRLRELKG